MTMLRDVLHESSHFMQRDFGEITLLQNSLKGTQDFATKCYERLKSRLTKSIQEKRPNYPIILPHEKPPLKGDYFIVIEPIAGINNFKRGIPFCAISAALFKTQECEPIAIAIHNPILRETFYTGKLLGAWFENYNDTIVPKSRMRVSNQINFDNAFINSSHNKSLQHLNLSCDILEIAYFAGARFDIIIKKLDNLMSKAATIFVTESGGNIKYFDEYFLASNDKLLKSAIEHLT